MIQLKEGSQPFHRQSRYMGAEQRVVDTELERMIKLGIIYKTLDGKWASPILLIRKKSGEIRFCIDFRLVGISLVLWQRVGRLAGQVRKAGKQNWEGHTKLVRKDEKFNER